MICPTALVASMSIEIFVIFLIEFLLFLNLQFDNYQNILKTNISSNSIHIFFSNCVRNSINSDPISDKNKSWLVFFYCDARTSYRTSHYLFLFSFRFLFLCLIKRKKNPNEIGEKALMALLSVKSTKSIALNEKGERVCRLNEIKNS